MGVSRTVALRIAVALALFANAPELPAKELTQTTENTISVRLISPVRPLAFSRPVKFYIHNVIDRSGNPNPLIVARYRGGIFLDKEPTKIVREALETSLEKAGVLVSDETAADYSLDVYIFQFSLDQNSLIDLFARFEFEVTLEAPASGTIERINALGTSIQRGAFKKERLKERVAADLAGALESGLRNFLHGRKLKDLVDGVKASDPSQRRR